ncbi:MAG TPA: CocE/NonD family hydrolase [Mycobacterium sp.]|nr:CocE/NonD family hydrolase [Mycobacterium sp.]
MSRHDEVIYRPALPPETAQANWRGFSPGRSVLAAGTTFSVNGRPLSCDIALDRDVALTLTDGTTVYADVYAPTGGEAVPAILVWSPYGKQGGFWSYDMFPLRAGVAEDATSGLEKFEGPDPAFWCAHGYAIVNVDPRGAFESQGHGQFFSPQEAQDGYDVVEWIAAQSWCTGAVAMAGNSWLAAMQWRIAALRPPHLVAIAPWEGFTDVYRDLTCRGGIPEQIFVETLVANNFGRQQVEDAVAMTEKHPVLDDYWRSKIADIEAIDVPAYVVASWTNPLHVRGTFDAFSRLDPTKSWLRVHNSLEWPDQYAHEDDLLRFFDHIVKGADNHWPRTPRVRLTVLDPGGTDVECRPEGEWPLARATEQIFYLDAAGDALSAQLPHSEHSVTIDAAHGLVAFRTAFDEDVELAGSMAVHLYLSAQGASDVDVYVFVRKLDAAGEPLMAYLPMGVPLPGAKGQLRTSHRELDTDASTELVPVHRHEITHPLAPGEIVSIDVPIWPLAMTWHAGEQLELLISTQDLFPTSALVAGPPQLGEDAKSDAGQVTLWTGGQRPARLAVSRS